MVSPSYPRITGHTGHLESQRAKTLTREQAQYIIANSQPMPISTAFVSITTPQLVEIGVTVDQLNMLPPSVYDGQEVLRDEFHPDGDEHPQQVHVFIKSGLDELAAGHGKLTYSGNGHGKNGHYGGRNGRG